MVNNIDESIKNPQLNKWAKDNYGVSNCTDSGSGISVNDLVEVSSNQVRKSTEQSTTVLGVAENNIAASAHGRVLWGSQRVKLASPVTIFDELSARADGRAAKKMTAQVDIASLQAGGNFANQPAGDAVEIVSDSASDTQVATIYGTITGALTTVTTETITLTGTSVATTTTTTWETILGIEIDSNAVGTITFREASGDLAITTITAGNASAGVATLASTNGYGLVLRHDASGASTKNVGIVGTAPDGTSTSAVDALNGATEEDHGTQAFGTVTKVLIGDVESAVNAVILTNEVVDSTTIGMAMETQTASGVLCDANIVPYHIK